MAHLLTDLKSFLESSPTSWHAAKQLCTRFAIRDFSPLKEDERWNLEPGKKYFLERGGAVCAFCLPLAKPTEALLLASHTDSPALKLKPDPAFTRENMQLFGTEIYGSPLLSSWLNRDLYLAGKVVIRNSQDQIEEKLIAIDDALLFIPQLAIHLDREVNEKGLILDKQEHLCPFVGLSGETTEIEALIRRHLHFQALLSFELFLVPIEPVRFLGADNEMIASSRLDNLASAHACSAAMAYLESPSQTTLQIAFFTDHEEVGSHTREGAASPFVNDTLNRIAFAIDIDCEELLAIKHRSLCVSVDMAHALNPNYPKKHDPNHPPLLGKGVVIKHNANQKYATNAYSAGHIVQACKELNLPYQTFASRSDLTCGSTIGPMIAAATGINTVDIGAPQLSMHSIREAMAVQDYLDLCRLLAHLVRGR